MNLLNPVAPTEHSKQLLIKIYRVDLVGGPFISEGKQIGQVTFLVGKGIELPSKKLLEEMFPPFLRAMIVAANPELEKDFEESANEQKS